MILSTSMVTESPLMVKNENIQKTPSSSKKGIRKNLFRSAEKSHRNSQNSDILNESLEVLEKGIILTPSPHGPRSRRNGSVNSVRRQLRLSESEK
jgi:hypothetical protein